jgi:type II secretory pathway pseudopilin PulG
LTSKRGVTMVELGMAIVILGMVFVPTLGLVQTGVKGTAESLHLTRAFQAARSAVDAIESFPYEKLDLNAAQALVDLLPVPKGVKRPQLIGLDVVDEPAKNGERVRAKVVGVRVYWDKVEGKGGTGEVVLRAMVVSAR